MYHALAIGLSDGLLASLQSIFLHYLRFTAAATLHMANLRLAETEFHLLIVSLEYLRGIQQVHWLSSLRNSSFAPVIVLSDTPERDLPYMVNLGADTCISSKWPYNDIAELIYAQLRRYTEYNFYDNPSNGEVSAFQEGDIFIDLARHTVKVKGQQIELRPREFSLLQYFMRNPNIVLTSEQICEQAWGMERIYTHGVAQPIRLLRLAIEPVPEKPIYIRTVYRVGYRFTPNSIETCELC